MYAPVAIVYFDSVQVYVCTVSQYRPSNVETYVRTGTSCTLPSQLTPVRLYSIFVQDTDGGLALAQWKHGRLSLRCPARTRSIYPILQEHYLVLGIFEGRLTKPPQFFSCRRNALPLILRFVTSESVGRLCLPGEPVPRLHNASPDPSYRLKLWGLSFKAFVTILCGAF
ncbi:hypothetical protein B0H34DRAFT_94731 [Crassisporium funariophilum]|nr:hypothetical protein B0H34DRAFT_94731 [Crassisporium funariophilum]